MKRLKTALLLAVLSCALIACSSQAQPPSSTELPSGELSQEVAATNTPVYQRIVIIRDDVIASITAAGLTDPTSLPEKSHRISVSGNGNVWTEAVAEPRYINSDVYLYPGRRGVELMFEAEQSTGATDRYRVRLIMPRDMNAGVYEIAGSDPTAMTESGQLVALATYVTDGDNGESVGVDYADMVQGTLWLASPVGDTITGAYQFGAVNDAGEQVTATGVFHQLLKEPEWWFRAWGGDQFSRPSYRPHGGGVSSEPVAGQNFFRLFLRHRTDAYSAEIIFELPLDIQTRTYDFADLDLDAFVIGGIRAGSYHVVDGWLSIRRADTLIDGSFEFQAVDDFSDLTVTVEGEFERAPIPQTEG